MRFVGGGAAIACAFFCTLGFAQEQAKESKVKESKPVGSASPAQEKSGAGKKSGGFDLNHPAEPVTTEIYADDAFFDSAKNIGKFSGHVKVNDPRFAMQSEKLTAYISKENKGLEKAVADGQVGVVRDRPDPNGGPPQRTISLSDNAIYTTNDGIVQLMGNPRVQQGVNMHIASSPDTVMILNQEGQLTTHGPSRTEIRQEPSPSPSPSASAAESPKQ
jgi:lipopolysaccharide export system protein LptA